MAVSDTEGFWEWFWKRKAVAKATVQAEAVGAVALCIIRLAYLKGSSGTNQGLNWEEYVKLAEATIERRASEGEELVKMPTREWDLFLYGGSDGNGPPRLWLRMGGFLDQMLAEHHGYEFVNKKRIAGREKRKLYGVRRWWD